MEEGQSGNVRNQTATQENSDPRKPPFLGVVDAVDLRLEIYGNLQQGKSYFLLTKIKFFIEGI